MSVAIVSELITEACGRLSPGFAADGLLDDGAEADYAADFAAGIGWAPLPFMVRGFSL